VALEPARAASPLEKNFYLSGPSFSGELPPCPAALDRISQRFADTQAHFWANSATIVGFEAAREIAYSPWAVGSNPRRFCQALALVNDARWPQVPYRKHIVRYAIREDSGFAGFDWGVVCQWIRFQLGLSSELQDGRALRRPPDLTQGLRLPLP